MIIEEVLSEKLFLAAWLLANEGPEVQVAVDVVLVVALSSEGFVADLALVGAKIKVDPIVHLEVAFLCENSVARQASPLIYELAPKL